MVERPRYLAEIEQKLKVNPIVSLLGPRQAGKTTLAKLVQGKIGGTYFDLEDIRSSRVLAEPTTALERFAGLVVSEVRRGSRQVLRPFESIGRHLH